MRFFHKQLPRMRQVSLCWYGKMDGQCSNAATVCAISVRNRRLTRIPISASPLSPNNSPPWPSCCSFTTEIFPDFPAYGKSIALRNLLNHTSGLPDYEDLMDAVEKTKGPTWTPEKQIHDDEVLELLKKEKNGKFAPGSSWSYSNSGYVVLGTIVAKVSGKTYGDFLRERIFTPLKMDHTIVFQKGENEVANRAFGHSKENNALKETDQSSTSATLGDGGIYSNLEDL